MVVSTDPIWEGTLDEGGRDYEDAVVYADAAGETVLHEGAVRLLPNGWLELPSGRLLSSDAVHHVDPAPSR